MLHPESHKSKNTPAEHLLRHYSTLNDVKDQKFDGLIITGAPVEHLDFEDVDHVEFVFIDGESMMIGPNDLDHCMDVRFSLRPMDNHS